MTGDGSETGGEADRAEIVRQSEASTSAYWLALADLPGGKRHVNAGLTWVYTGYPVLNRVLDARLSPTSADDRIRDVVERFGAWEAGVIWLVGPSTHPRAFGRALEAHGFALVGRWTGMAHALSRPVDARAARAGFSVHPIAAEEWADEWLHILGASFRLSPATQDVFRHLVRRAGTERKSNSFVHYIGTWNGDPVCTASMLITEADPAVAGIYLVGTLPGSRSRGYGSAIMRHVLVVALACGCRRAVLQATGDGRSLYRSLGFRDLCTFDLYRWAPAMSPQRTWRGRSSRSFQRERASRSC